MSEKTNLTSAQKEVKKLSEQFDKFDQEVKDLTLDRMNASPKEETEKQTKLSSNEVRNSKDLYLKPEKKIPDNQKFNEKFRSDWEFKKEYVHFIAEHKELIGETIEMWTHPFGGVGCEFWKIPTNKPVWGPRYLAEQIKGRMYHRLVMNHAPTHSTGEGQFYGTMAADSVIQRMDAYPVNEKRSIFRSKTEF